MTMNQMKKWVRAVWREEDREMEDTLPSIWVQDNKIRWPNASNYMIAYKEHRKPAESWLTFDLVKIKFTSDNRKDCQMFDETTANESGDSSTEAPIGKRKQVKRVLPDFVMDSGEQSEVQNQPQQKKKAYAETSLVPPRAPEKISNPLEKTPSKRGRKNTSTKQAHAAVSPSSSDSSASSSERSNAKQPVQVAQRKERSSLRTKAAKEKLSSILEKLRTKRSEKTRANKEGHTERARSENREDIPNSRSESQGTSRSRYGTQRSSSSPEKSRSGSFDIKRSERRHRVSSLGTSQDMDKFIGSFERAIPRSRSRSISRERSRPHSRQERSRSRSTNRLSFQSNPLPSLRPYSRQERSRSRSTHRSALQSCENSRARSRHERSRSGQRSISRERSRPLSRQERSRSRSAQRSSFQGEPLPSLRRYSGQGRSRSRSVHRSSSRSRQGRPQSISDDGTSQRDQVERSRSRSGHNVDIVQGGSGSASRRGETGRREENFPLSTERFQRRVLYLLIEIRQTLTQSERPREVNDSTQQALIYHPIECMDDFDDLEEKLSTDSLRASMKNTLRRIGGIDAVDQMKKIMLRTMTNGFMAKFNMRGKKNKRAFSATNLYKVIKDVVLNSNAGMTEQKLNSEISNFLKYAPERSGGGGRRQ